MRRAVVGRVSLAVVAALPLLSCSPPRTGIVPPPAPRGDRITYAALGSIETQGEAGVPRVSDWPHVFFQTVLPDKSEMVSVAAAFAGVGEALKHQVPTALDAEPAVVSVWFNLIDMANGVPVDEFETDLASVIRQMSRGGRAVVLVANAPPVDVERVPRRFRSRVPVMTALVDPYNAAIARAVAAEGAQLVDMHKAITSWFADARDDELLDPSGWPTVEGHREIAALFAAAYKAAKAAGPAPPG